MSEIKKQLSDFNIKEKNSMKELDLDHTEDEGCCKSIQKKFQYCTDVLANYFQCLRVFSDQKLQELRRKAIDQDLQSQIHNKSIKSQASIQNEKYSQIQNKSQFKQHTKKQRNILIEDFNELPANNYATNQRLKFTKRYTQTYDQSYSERKNKFAYSFQQVQIERQRQYMRKEKNFWEEFKRFICCRGGNYIQQLEQKQTFHESNFSSFQISQHNSQKELKKEPSLRSQKNNQQNNIFLFQEPNQINEVPEEIAFTKHGKKINRNLKVIGQQGKTQKGSSRKSQNLQVRQSKQGQARKVSSRLGVDTQLLIKRKQYQQKNDAQYIYQQNNHKNLQSNNNNNNQYYTFNNYNNNNSNNYENNNNQYNNEDYNNSNRQNMRQGVEKKRGDKKDKISKMLKQIQNQNQEQFIDNQVSFGNNSNRNNNTNSNTIPNNNTNNNNDYNTNDRYNPIQNNKKDNNDNINEEYNNLDQSIVKSINNSNISYQRSRKGKKQKNINIDTTNNDNVQEYIPDMNINDGTYNNNKNDNTYLDQSQVKNNQHAHKNQKPHKQAQSHLIIKQRNTDGMFDQSMDQIPDVNLSLNLEENQLSVINKTQAPAFKKKRKNKKNLTQLQTIQDKDDIIVMNQNTQFVHTYQNNNDTYKDIQNYNNNYNSNKQFPATQPINRGNQSYNFGNQQSNNQPKMNKKKRNKRKALVVEQDEDQDVVDLEDL